MDETTLLIALAYALHLLVIVAVSNAIFLPRLKTALVPPAAKPQVSMLLPARNEAANIGRAVSELLAQDYGSFEIIILDDQSTDGTATLALAAAEGDPRVRVLEGKSLPPGWLGKNWACHQLSEAATGDLLLFTDADVRWSPHALSGLVAESTRHSADLLSVMPTQETVTWSERLVVPMMSFAVLAYLPVVALHTIPWSAFAVAIGQCLFFRREAYDRIGGHAAVRDEVVEDVVMARRIKAGRMRLRLADGNQLISCRMYTDWPEVRDGFAKNMLAGFAESVPFLLLATLFHWAVFVLPWFLWGLSPWFAVAGLVGIGIRALVAWTSGQRLIDAILLPFSIALVTVIAFRSIWWHYRGGPLWKGRVARV